MTNESTGDIVFNSDNAIQESLFTPSEENNYFKEYKFLKPESCEEELREQIWGKAIRLYALENEREEFVPVDFVNRFFNMLNNNHHEVTVIEENQSGKQRYIELPWKGTYTRFKYDEENMDIRGFVLHVFLGKEDPEESQNKGDVYLHFTKKEFENRDEEKEIFDAILLGLEEQIYSN